MVASVSVSQISSLFCNDSFLMLQQMMCNVATVSFLVVAIGVSLMLQSSS